MRALALDRKLRPSICILSLIGVWIAIYLLGLGALRIVRDDWSNLLALRELPKNEGVGAAILSIVQNSWISGTPRVFFGAFLLQFLFVGLFGFHGWPYFLFILVAHLAATLACFGVLRRVLRDSFLAFWLALIMLVAPTSNQALFFLNNWFFSVPFYLFCLQISLLARNRELKWGGLIALTIVTLLGQFSGEQTILMFYLSLGIFLLAGWPRSRRLAFPGVVSALALVVYWEFVQSLPRTQAHLSSGAISVYLSQFFSLVGSNLWGHTYTFGFFTLPPDPATLIVLAVLAVGMGWAYFKMSREKMEASLRARAVVMASLLGFAAASLVPCLYGAATGARPGANTRYIFVTSIPLLMFAALALDSAIALLGAPRFARALTAFLTTLYLAVLMTYQLRVVWNEQRRIDDRIWAAIDANWRPGIANVLTFNLSETQAQLMAHNRSEAVSDFQADWGVAARIRVVHGDHVDVGYRATPLPDGNLRITGYYGDQWTARPDQIMVLTYRYGGSFAELARGTLTVDVGWDRYARRIRE